jgi:hypothetical protein
MSLVTRKINSMAIVSLDPSRFNVPTFYNINTETVLQTFQMTVALASFKI